jgi:glycerate-2-kinase
VTRVDVRGERSTRRTRASRDAAPAPAAVRRALAALFGAATAALVPDRLIARVRRRIRLGPELVIVGAGKGVAGLAAAAERVLGAAVVGGLVIAPLGHERPLARVALALGGHPLPDAGSVRATARLLRTLALHPAIPVLVLLTGGASSLLAAPAPGLTLADKRRTTALLLACGARIDEINTVRKHLSAIKGGRLAARLVGRDVLALVVSDVPDDDLGVIGSGPTVADATTFADARAVLRAHDLEDRVPARVRRHLAAGVAGALADTPKRGARALRSTRTLLLASNATARAGAAAHARAHGYDRIIDVRTPLTGPTVAAAAGFAARIRRCQAHLRGTRPALLLAGGETTVALGSTRGRGGRNQEFALEVARRLAGRPGWALLSAGSDGIDGPTDAAGAFADGATIARAVRAGCSVDDALARHDVFPLLDRLRALYRTGPTGTNVADLKIALVWRDRGWRLPSAL